MTDLLAIHAAAAAKSTRDLVRSYGVRQCLCILTLKDAELSPMSGRVNWWGLLRFGFKSATGAEFTFEYSEVKSLVSV